MKVKDLKEALEYSENDEEVVFFIQRYFGISEGLSITECENSNGEGKFSPHGRTLLIHTVQGEVPDWYCDLSYAEQLKIQRSNDDWELYDRKKTIKLPEYEMVNGIKYPILGRKKGSKLTDKCPYCGKKHLHGKGDGHREGHCTDTIDSRGKCTRLMSGFFASDGYYFPPAAGYIIREY